MRRCILVFRRGGRGCRQIPRAKNLEFYRIGFRCALALRPVREFRRALFADGAGACVLWHEQKGLELVASSSLHVPEQRAAVRYVHRGGQLHNQLSPHLPLILKEPVKQVVHALLEPRGLRVAGRMFSSSRL